MKKNLSEIPSPKPPFFRFYSEEHSGVDEIEALKLQRWITGFKEGLTNGLLILPKDNKSIGKSHLLYIIADEIGCPIMFSADLIERAGHSIKGEGYNKFIEDLVERWPFALDDIGRERKIPFLDPMGDLIKALWAEGKGIIGASSKTKQELLRHFDEPVARKIFRSALTVEVGK